MTEDELTPPVEDSTYECAPEGADVELKFTSVEEDLCLVDKTFNKTAARREEIVTIVEGAIKGMKLDLNGDAELLEAQAKLLSMASSLLNDQERSAHTRASLKLKVKVEDETSLIGKGITEFLARIDMRNQNGLGNLTLTEAEGMEIIKNQFQERGCAVIQDTELGMDADDVHSLSSQIRQEEEEARANRK